MTERFTRVDEETILYEFTVDDPTVYTEPWGGEVPFRRFNDLLYEYACHEGNYSSVAFWVVLVTKKGWRKVAEGETGPTPEFYAGDA